MPASVSRVRGPDLSLPLVGRMAHASWPYLACHPGCRRPTLRGAGQGQGDQVERPTGRTTWSPWPWSARLAWVGGWRDGRLLNHPPTGTLLVGKQIDQVRRCGGSWLLHQPLVLEVVFKPLFRLAPRRRVIRSKCLQQPRHIRGRSVRTLQRFPVDGAQVVIHGRQSNITDRLPADRALSAVSTRVPATGCAP